MNLNSVIFHLKLLLFIKAELTKKFVEEQLPASLGHLEKMLKENNGGNGYLVGDGVSAFISSFK